MSKPGLAARVLRFQVSTILRHAPERQRRNIIAPSAKV
jgi:hypothetical protein